MGACPDRPPGGHAGVRWPAGGGGSRFFYQSQSLSVHVDAEQAKPARGDEGRAGFGQSRTLAGYRTGAERGVVDPPARQLAAIRYTYPEGGGSDGAYDLFLVMADLGTGGHSAAHRRYLEWRQCCAGRE